MTNDYSARTRRIARAIETNEYIRTQAKALLELKPAEPGISVRDRSKLIEAFGAQMQANLDHALEFKSDETPEF